MTEAEIISAIEQMHRQLKRIEAGLWINVALAFAAGVAIGALIMNFFSRP